MSQLPSPGKIGWHDKLKYVIVYPCEYDLVASSVQQEFVLGVVEEVSIEGVGYEHEDINALTNWGLGKRTKPPTNKNGRIIVSETEWAYTLLRWLASVDGRFDVKVIELPQAQNPGYGQWAAGQESYIGCYVNPISKRYEIGGQPYSTVPFTWTEFKFISQSTSVYIGSGIFVGGAMPTVPT